MLFFFFFFEALLKKTSFKRNSLGVLSDTRDGVVAFCANVQNFVKSILNLQKILNMLPNSCFIRLRFNFSKSLKDQVLLLSIGLYKCKIKTHLQVDE